MNPQIAIILAEGFEEIEAIAPADILRRLGFNVCIAGQNKKITGSHGITASADAELRDLKPEQIDCLVLPGGMPGSVNLKNNPAVIKLAKNMASQNKIICAICAAPIVLAEAGLLIKGIRVTAHPSVKDQLGAAEYTGQMTEIHSNIITGKGPGSVFEFARAIASSLGKKNEAEKLLKDMFIVT
jgi:4-methyl-5(b-hydroxyethyl)-thiazole monophosphate biosynthesis